MMHLLTAALVTLTTACLTSEPSLERPTRHFDFAAIPLGGELTRAPSAGTSVIQRLRNMLDHARPQIAQCLVAVPHTRAIDLALTLAVEPGAHATVESTEVTLRRQDEAPPDDLGAENAACRCVRDALSAVDTESLGAAKEVAYWTVAISMYSEAR